MTAPRDLPEGPIEESGDLPSRDDASLIALFRRLAEQAQSLVRQEVALAKAEIRESVRDLAVAAGVMTAGALMILVSLTVFLVFLVLALGELLGERYWLSSLLIGLLFAICGIVLIVRGQRRLSGSDLVPEKTIESVQETARWATGEAQRFKTEKLSDSTRPSLPEAQSSTDSPPA